MSAAIGISPGMGSLPACAQGQGRRRLESLPLRGWAADAAHCLQGCPQIERTGSCSSTTGFDRDATERHRGTATHLQKLCRLIIHLGNSSESR